jgi:hypothetical protein
MTVRDLKMKLDELDDKCEVTMQMPDGREREITSASKQGDHLIIWADSSS